MSEWKEYKLGELTNWYSGGTPSKNNTRYWQGNIPWISAKTMTWHKITTSDLNISEEGLKSGSRLANVNDILLLVRGSGLFNDIPICLVEKPVSFNQDIKAIRAKNFKHQEFIYYWFHGNKKGLYEILEETGIGAGKFDTELLKNLDISIPLIHSEMEVVTSIAKSIFDKIDLLHRQNATLEAMAETLFKQWFVEEANEDWEEITLYDAIDLIGGGTPKTSMPEYWDGNIKWLSGGDIANNHKSIIISSEKSITELGLKNSSAKLLPKFSTIISARGTVGKYCILSEPMTFSQSNYGIKPKFDNCYFFTYLLIAHSVDELISAAYGSVFDTITTDTFKGHSVTLPKINIIKDFELEVTPLFKKMLNNQTQIRTLTALRDTLLPKLMSGEVRVEM